MAKPLKKSEDTLYERDFYAWTQEQYTDEQFAVLNRFKAIIELTFRRYLELQRAEEQAREAQIEASLELAQAILKLD